MKRRVIFVLQSILGVPTFSVPISGIHIAWQFTSGICRDFPGNKKNRADFFYHPVSFMTRGFKVNPDKLGL